MAPLPIPAGCSPKPLALAAKLQVRVGQLVASLPVDQHRPLHLLHSCVCLEVAARQGDGAAMLQSLGRLQPHAAHLAAPQRWHILATLSGQPSGLVREAVGALLLDSVAADASVEAAVLVPAMLRQLALPPVQQLQAVARCRQLLQAIPPGPARCAAWVRCCQWLAAHAWNTGGSLVQAGGATAGSASNAGSSCAAQLLQEAVKLMQACSPASSGQVTRMEAALAAAGPGLVGSMDHEGNMDEVEQPEQPCLAEPEAETKPEAEAAPLLSLPGQPAGPAAVASPGPAAVAASPPAASSGSSAGLPQPPSVAHWGAVGAEGPEVQANFALKAPAVSVSSVAGAGCSVSASPAGPAATAAALPTVHEAACLAGQPSCDAAAPASLEFPAASSSLCAMLRSGGGVRSHPAAPAPPPAPVPAQPAVPAPPASAPVPTPADEQGGLSESDAEEGSEGGPTWLDAVFAAQKRALGGAGAVGQARQAKRRQGMQAPAGGSSFGGGAAPTARGGVPAPAAARHGGMPLAPLQAAAAPAVPTGPQGLHRQQPEAPQAQAGAAAGGPQAGAAAEDDADVLSLGDSMGGGQAMVL